MSIVKSGGQLICQYMHICMLVCFFFFPFFFSPLPPQGPGDCSEAVDEACEEQTRKNMKAQEKEYDKERYEKGGKQAAGIPPKMVSTPTPSIMRALHSPKHLQTPIEEK